LSSAQLHKRIIQQNSTDPALDAILITTNLTNTLSAIDAYLPSYPPMTSPPSGRRSILNALDLVLNQSLSYQKTYIQDWFHNRITLLLASLNAYTYSMGTKIFHAYNEGYLVKTGNVTLCFDLTRRPTLVGFAIPNALMINISAHCDVLFISHQHIDHYDTFVVNLMTTKGVPVVAPPDVGISPLANITRNLVNVMQNLTIQNGNASIGVYVYPGHQNNTGSSVLNNIVVVVTPDGLRIANIGDQDVCDALLYPWFSTIYQNTGAANVYFMKVYASPKTSFAQAFNPDLVIGSHIQELGHTVPEGYYKMLNLFEKYSIPMLTMFWGESYVYQVSTKTIAK